MNTQEYIDSGILEVYAAGGLTDTERADVDRMAALHPGVKAALEEAHLAIEAYALQHAQTPPAYLQDRILQQIQHLGPGQSQSIPAPATGPDQEAPRQNPASPLAQAPVTSHAPEATVISMPQDASRLNWLGNGLRAAAMILLLLSATANIYFFSQWKEAEQELAVAQQSVKQYAYETSQLEYRTDRTENLLAVVRDPQTQTVVLKGTPQHATAAAKVFWNQETKEVFFDPTSLPQAPSDKQYQLWALVDGKPVDAGMVASSPDFLLRMKAVEKAQAFAVTLEPKGGSVNPTMEAMFVMGAI